MTAARRSLLVTVLVVAGSLGVPAPRSLAAPDCAPGGAPPPSGAIQRTIGDLDWDGRPDTLWLGQFRDSSGRTDRVVGVTTASGANSAAPVVTASPIPLSALAIDAQRDGQHQVIVSDGRGAHLYVFADCRLQAAVDNQGAAFQFDLQNLREKGTGIGCSDLGNGRRLVGLQAVEDGGQWSVRRTEIDMNGTLATIGRSDVVPATSAQDPAVVSAQTISCGNLTIGQDGVQQH